MGFHMLDLVVVLLIGLVLVGPKALQSMARSAGKGIKEAKVMKDKVMAELPLEEISEVSRHISRVPMNPQQAVQMLITHESVEKSTEKTQKPKVE
jgi:Sec-independent protein translocase protein TatA